MNDDKSIMRYESVLPEDFTGVFYFTNWSQEDFTGVWDSKEYTFPAQTTTPLIVPDHSPIQVQHIRKKFAKDLAEREFFKSKDYSQRFLRQERNTDGSPKLNSIHQAGSYTITELTPFIQKCLEPLPIAKALVTEAKKQKMEDVLSRNDDGELNTKPVDSRTSLRDKALKGEKF